MTKNVGYPAKTRNVALGKLFPGRTRSVGCNESYRGVGKPSQHGTTHEGKKPRKGVLTKGGGHG